ncbi:MAG: nuclear transport factor 2 family protein [Gemmatimonadota bacterium]|nr:nuclear transport factor 2 family protein [Gemmatimonadota bacterium]
MSDLTSEDRARLTAMVEHTWTNAGLTKDWSTAMSMCADDIVYMPPDTPACRGKAETLAYLNDFPAMDAFSQSVDRVLGDTERAVMIGSFNITMEEEGQKVAGTGKFLGSVTKASGDWLFEHVCFNFDGAPVPVD